MPLPGKNAIEPIGMRLDVKAMNTLRIVAAERRTNVSALTTQALALWWEQQPEAKIRGPLFPPRIAKGKALPKASASVPSGDEEAP